MQQMQSSETSIHLLTQDSALDALSPDTYREIYDEVRQYDVETNKYGISLDKFVEAFGAGGPTKAEWSRYHNYKRDLSREMRNILRTAVGLPVLGPTVQEVIDVHVEPNARVYKVGDEDLALRVVLLATLEPVTVHANGTVSVVDFTPSSSPDEEQSQPAGERVQRCTAPRASVSMARETFGRANTLRQFYGLTWEALIDVALETLAGRATEEETNNADASA